MRSPGEGRNSPANLYSIYFLTPLSARRFLFGFLSLFFARRNRGIFALICRRILLSGIFTSIFAVIGRRTRIGRRVGRGDDHRNFIFVLIEEANQTLHRKLSLFELSGKHQLQAIDHGRIEQSGGNHQVDGIDYRPTRYPLHIMGLPGFLESTDRNDLVQSASDISRSETAPETAVFT